MTGSGHDHRDPSCLEMFARLSEYIDGELPEDFCRRIEEHMGDCTPCQGFLASLRRTVALLHADEPGDLPEDLVRDLLERARTRGDP